MARAQANTAMYDIGREMAAALDRILRNATFEIIPLRGVEEQASHLPPGTTIPVTASPDKGMDASIALTGWAASIGLDPLPHLSARLIVDKPQLAQIIDHLDGLAIKSVFVVGGDGEPQGEFYDGLSLLQAMDELGHPFEEIGVPSYPEGHHVIPDEALAQALLDKQQYAHYMTTQMCFDPATVVSWVEHMRSIGVELPVHIGLPGVAPLRKLLAISTRIGVGASLRYLTKQHGLLGKLARPGGYAPDELLVGLGDGLLDPANKIDGVRFFTFNQVESTEEWRREFMWDLHRVLN